MFIMASDKEIKEGKTTDIYFIRTVKILKEDGLDKVNVHAELTVSSLPKGYPWGFLGGLRDTIKLLEGLPIDVDAVPEGSVIFDKDYYGVKVPIMTIRGPYAEFAIYETPLLGFLAFGSGVLTKTARLRKIAGKNIVLLSFGARRMHPALSPFIDFYAYIGGCDGISSVLSAEKFLNTKPTGTMPHSLLIIYRVIKGDHGLAWKAFDKYMPPDVPRIMLTDTYYDEVEESIRAVEYVGKDRIWGVRLDTPSSRRGKFEEIVKEVIWELKARGYDNVKIVVSGGIDEDVIPKLVKVGVKAFGIGTAIATAKIIDIAMDIVAVEKNGRWVPCAKRGKFSGVKKVYRCNDCLIDIVKLEGEKTPKCPKCGKEMEPLLKPMIRNGKIVYKFPTPKEEREYVLKQLEKLDLNKKPWE